MRILARIRQAIRLQRYRLSAHANAEMADDALEARDIEAIIQTGTSRGASRGIRVVRAMRSLAPPRMGGRQQWCAASCRRAFY